MIIDTHCHFDMMSNPETYIQKMEKEKNIVIGMTNLPSHFETGLPHTVNLRHIRLALGFHPQMVANNSHELSLFIKNINKTSYIGEIGLDFSKNHIHSKLQQIKTLEIILANISGKKKIISVHSRSAEKELLELLIKYNIQNVIFHWYSGRLNLIDKIIDQGYYFSINEYMTSSISGQKIISRIPRNRLLTESDAPFNTRNDIQKTLSYLNLTQESIYNNFMTLLEQIK